MARSAPHTPHEFFDRALHRDPEPLQRHQFNVGADRGLAECLRHLIDCAAGGMADAPAIFSPAVEPVIELERSVALFKGRIDSTSKTLSKNSSMLFTANQLRQYVKVFLTGSWQMGSVDFEKAAHELLDVEEGVFERELEKATRYTNYLAERIPVWRKISHLPAGGTTAAQIRDLRQEGFLCLSAVGLVIIASIGHDLFKVEHADWQGCADRLSSLDWSLDGELWRGNVVSVDRKILAQQALVRTATGKVRKAIGLPTKTDDIEESVQALLQLA